MSTYSNLPPVQGPSYDPARPETKPAWLEYRQQGLTATEVRDWVKGGAHRHRIITGKTTTAPDFDTPAFQHGRLREPIIADWVHALYGIRPCNAVYAQGDNPRWLASPDGILDVDGDTWLCEIKTSRHDLTPGPVDADNELLHVAPGSVFAQSGYYTQMQAQMLVMNAHRCLFVWEQHDGTVDPETGTYNPAGAPEVVWVLRDEDHIRELIGNVYGPALEQIDTARLTVAAGGDIPVEGLPVEHAALVAELFAAREAETVAKKARETAWKALQAVYTGEGAPDVALTAPGFANVTVNNIETPRRVVDMDGARAKAPALVAKYEALVERFTTVELVTKQTLTITPNNQ